MKKTFQKIKLYENSKKLQKPVLSISPNLIYLYWGGNSKNSGRIYFSKDSIVVKLNNKEGSISFNYEGDCEYEDKNKFEIKKVKNKYKIIFEDYKDYYSFTETILVKNLSLNHLKKSKPKSPKKSKPKSPKKSKPKSPKKSKPKSPKKSKVKIRTSSNPKCKINRISIKKQTGKSRRKKTATTVRALPKRLMTFGTVGWKDSMTKLKFEVRAEGSSDTDFYYYPCCTGAKMPYQYGSFKAVFFLKAFSNDPKDFGNQEFFTNPVKNLPTFFPDIAVRLNTESILNKSFANYVIVMPQGISNNIIRQNTSKDFRKKLSKYYDLMYDPTEFIDEMNLGYFFGKKDIGLEVKLIQTKIDENTWSVPEKYGFFKKEEELSYNKTIDASRSRSKNTAVKKKSSVTKKITKTTTTRVNFMNELYFGVVEIGDFNLTSQQYNESALARICHKLANLEKNGQYNPYIYLDIKSNNMCTKLNTTYIDDQTNLYLVDFDTKYCKPVALPENYDRNDFRTKLTHIMVLGYLVAEMFGYYTIEILNKMLITFENIVSRYIILLDDRVSVKFTLFDNIPNQVIKMAAERWRYYGKMAFTTPHPILDPDNGKEGECSWDEKIYNYKILMLLAKVYEYVLAKTTKGQPSDQLSIFYYISNYRINIVNSQYDDYIDRAFLTYSHEHSLLEYNYGDELVM
jgi:hypothetical protein